MFPRQGIELRMRPDLHTCYQEHQTHDTTIVEKPAQHFESEHRYNLREEPCYPATVAESRKAVEAANYRPRNRGGQDESFCTPKIASTALSSSSSR
jgi:hypothetical protein